MPILNKISASSKDKIATNSQFIISEHGIVIAMSRETPEASIHLFKEDFEEL